MKIALAQINPTIGDFANNLAIMSSTMNQAMKEGCRLILFPELAVTGYPPMDLLNRSSFVEAAQDALTTWVETLPSDSPAIITGAVVNRNTHQRGRRLWNAGVYIANNQIVSVHPKTLLPSYDVFDEDRWFEPLDEEPTLVEIDGVRIGVTICEDIWTLSNTDLLDRYHQEPMVKLVEMGAQWIVNLSASPFSVGKGAERRTLLTRQAESQNVPILYVNQVGGNDDLIFDGRSLVVNGRGELVAQGKAFQEDLLIADTDELHRTTAQPAMTPDDEVTKALILGVRDYFAKIGATQAVLGLSGGIDSALTATIAADALGSQNVVGIGMPSEFSSEGSLRDAEELAQNLGITYHVIPIQPALDAIRTLLRDVLGTGEWGVTDENIQARIRGLVLMAYSNRHGHLVLSTGNKSEVATGYCTLYGDMCGGMAVLSDVPKTMVYSVSRALNRDGVRIPVSTIEKPPSAELRPDQRDDQSLPAYDVLDRILELHVVDQIDKTMIVNQGFDPHTVQRVIGLVDRSEYKRRQMPVGLRVTTKAFGSGRRLPIAHRWREEKNT
jgi:NAD+ synthase (glutamine-hydrolysing)